MRSKNLSFLLLCVCLAAGMLCNAQVTDTIKMMEDAAKTPLPIKRNCGETTATLLLNSTKEMDDWTVIKGPVLPGIVYPFAPVYSKPYPSWEMDRRTGDSSYFKNCDWMILPDNRKVINTASRLPIVFIKNFTTTAPTKVKLLVKMLYDNMAYLYIDSLKIPLNHNNADINRFIKEIKPELSSLVSIPTTFNDSHHASFYAGDIHNLILAAGDHTMKIELYNNANELGCIIKGMLLSGDNEKVFCATPIAADTSFADILVHQNINAFPRNAMAGKLYDSLMGTVKNSYWVNHLLPDTQNLISNDTLFIKKGEKINMMPAFVREFHNGSRDTIPVWGKLKKLNASKQKPVHWNKTFAFAANQPGRYSLEINCGMPEDTENIAKFTTQIYHRIIYVK